MNSNTAFSKSSSSLLRGLGAVVAAAAFCSLAVFAAAGRAQPPAPAPNDAGAMNAPVVTLRRAHTVALQPGHAVFEVLEFQVSPGYHVNSNHPNSAFLIATTLHFATARTGIAVRAIRWPRPHELKFQFSPQPLSVFSGTFPVRILLRAAPGARSQILKGTLRYQACNDTLCRPPASLPVAIHLTVR